MKKPDIVYTERRRIPVAIQRYVLWRDKGLCVTCGEASKCEMDHCPPWNLLDPKRHDPDKIFLKCKRCHSVKSRRDTTEAARAKRLEKKHKGEYRETKHKLKSRGFSKTHSRGFDGKVRPKR